MAGTGPQARIREEALSAPIDPLARSLTAFGASSLIVEKGATMCPIEPGRPTDVFAYTISRRDMIGSALLGGLALSLPRPVPASGQEATPSTGAKTRLGDALPDLSPQAVWQHFYDLTRIPRPTHHEEEVSASLAEFGRGLGLETRVDEVGNVLIRKPATTGMEESQGVVLQAQMDMVPVKVSDSDHDFETDPIDAYVEDGWVRADETTLGADDGIGVAMVMAVLEADDIAHGPLEGLFTVNEGDGFTGAGAVQPGVLRGTTLINVDSEEAGVFKQGLRAVGARTTEMVMAATRELYPRITATDARGFYRHAGYFL